MNEPLTTGYMGPKLSAKGVPPVHRPKFVLTHLLLCSRGLVDDHSNYHFLGNYYVHSSINRCDLIYAANWVGIGNILNTSNGMIYFWYFIIVVGIRKTEGTQRNYQNEAFKCYAFKYVGSVRLRLCENFRYHQKNCSRTSKTVTPEPLDLFSSHSMACCFLQNSIILPSNLVSSYYRLREKC